MSCKIILVLCKIKYLAVSYLKGNTKFRFKNNWYKLKCFTSLFCSKVLIISLNFSNLLSLHWLPFCFGRFKLLWQCLSTSILPVLIQTFEIRTRSWFKKWIQINILRQRVPRIMKSCQHLQYPGSSSVSAISFSISDHWRLVFMFDYKTWPLRTILK